MTMGVPDLTVALTHLLLGFPFELVICVTLNYIVDELTKPVISHGIRMSLQDLITAKLNLITGLQLI